MTITDKYVEALGKIAELKLKYKELLRDTDNMLGSFKIEFGGIGCCDALVDHHRTRLKQKEKESGRE